MSNRALGAGLLALGSRIAFKEAEHFGNAIIRRARNRVHNSILGPAYSRYFSNRRVRDNSLMRLTSVRRRSTINRLNRRRRRRYRTRRYKRYSRRQRSRARSAMGTNSPAYRSRMRKSRYRSELGMPIGYMPSRKALIAPAVNDNLDDKTLHNYRLIGVDYNDADNVMNVRSGRLADVIGVKFRAWFKTKAQLIQSNTIWDQPIQVRWAIINPRTNTGAVTDITTANFFMSDAPGTDDAADFPTLNGTAFKFMNRKINTRQFGVLQEGTFLLSNDPAATDTRVDLSSRKFISFYVPIMRQMKWPSTTVGEIYPNANLHFVFWYCQQGSTTSGTNYTTDKPIEFMHENLTYFRNADALD